MSFYYQHSLPLEHLEVVDPAGLQNIVLRQLQRGWRLVCLCGLPGSALAELLPASTKGPGSPSTKMPGSPAAKESGPASAKESEDAPACLLCVLAHDSMGALRALRTPPLRAYPSLTPACPAAHLFEREIYEQWKILPEGHPWLKPVRYCPPFPEAEGPAAPQDRPLPGVTDYFTVQGPEVHEVAVGPVHAGVIEPGHFRFQCYGENVLHLEISLGFQHRGIEQQLLGGPDARTVYMMECLAGDSSIAHTTALCQLLETFTACPATARGQALRRVALELERLACHTGDLGAMAGDVGFLPTAAWCGRIRGDFLNMTALLCGNRFGRGLVRRGGVIHDVDAALVQEIRSRLIRAHRDVRGAVDVMFGASSVLARFEGTGTVSTATARELGMVGVPAKACGLAQDARTFYPPAMPWAHYDDAPAVNASTMDTLGAQDAPTMDAPRPRRQRLDKKSIVTAGSGDVLARAKVRSDELDTSVRLILADLDNLPEGPIIHDEIRSLPQQRLAVTFVEGWRGSVCHVGVTGPEGLFAVYKVIDPSFHNWMGLAMALRDEQISDFPLCNKSFNLSYCGHDL